MVVGTLGLRSEAVSATFRVETELASQRLLGNAEQRRSVLPALLEGNAAAECLPPQLPDRAYADFRDERYYFREVFGLLLAIYLIPPRDPLVDLQAELGP